MEKKPTLVEVKRKFREWRRNNKGEGLMPRRLKREAVHLLDGYSKVRLAKELGVTETALRAWQRRILEIEHDAGIDARIYEMPPKKEQEATPFMEIGAPGSGPPLDGGRPSLLLRRPDGGVLTVKGDLTGKQIKALTLTFLGDG